MTLFDKRVIRFLNDASNEKRVMISYSKEKMISKSFSNDLGDTD